jgi:Ni,Fe-hydrogenase III large subunit
MNILIGVIPQNDCELLLMLEDGKPAIRSCVDGKKQEKYPNYTMLKNRELKIADQPVSGPGVFRFRYGPVTSGVREAGCYNIYTYGEKILKASIDLSWKHRNIEKAMLGLMPGKGLQLAEFVCNNFAFAHSVAYSQAVEQALNIQPDKKTVAWRQLLLEAERVYNHLHVVYKLNSAAAQKVVKTHLHALYEQALRLNEQLSSSRFLAGFNRIGKINHFPEKHQIEEVTEGYQSMKKQFEELYRHSFDNTNYLDRIHNIGILSKQQAKELGLTGPSLRACGLNDDLNGSRDERPATLPVITQNEGDSLARMETRSEELVNSCRYIIEHLKKSGTRNQERNEQCENQKTAGEGWSIVHSASGAVGYYLQIENSKIQRIRICTPSYIGMQAIATTLPDHVFTDFPFLVDSFGINFADAAC